MQPEVKSHAARPPGYETTDVNLRGIFIFMGCLVLVCGIMYPSLAALMRGFERRAAHADRQAAQSGPVPAVARPQAYFPQPREQISPSEELKTFRARENAELNSYGWVDRDAGIVRIPIDRAMDILMERGLPTRGGPGDPNAGPSTLELQQQRPRYGTPANPKEAK